MPGVIREREKGQVHNLSRGKHPRRVPMGSHAHLLAAKSQRNSQIRTETGPDFPLSTYTARTRSPGGGGEASGPTSKPIRSFLPEIQLPPPRAPAATRDVQTQMRNSRFEKPPITFKPNENRSVLGVAVCRVKQTLLSQTPQTPPTPPLPPFPKE